MWWILTTLLVAILAFWLLKRNTHVPRAMKQFARKVAFRPGYSAGMSELLRVRAQLIDQANVLPPPAGDEIPDLITKLLSDNRDVRDYAQIRLHKAADTASDLLLDYLKSGRADWKKNGLLESSPAKRISDLLWTTQPRKLGATIGDLWTHDDYTVFTTAIRARAALGKADLAGWITQLLDDHAREHAGARAEAVANGVERAIAGGWADPFLIDQLLKWSQQTIATQRPASGSAIHWAASFYATHRRQDAIRLFTSEPVLSLNNNHSIHFILQQLNTMNVALSPNLLRPMLDKSLAATEWPWNRTFGATLDALAASDLPAAIQAAESAILHKEHSYASLKFLYNAHNLPANWATDPPEGFPLTQEQQTLLQHFSNVIEADGQIGNGGLSQYFFNSSGDHWPRDAASFDFIGYKVGGDAIRLAASMLAPGGASLDREERIRQYASLPEPRERELDRMSEVFWGPPLDVAEYQFMMRHPDLFRSIKIARLAAGIESST